ncbi:hypothetical protein ILUMI_24860, partial [Ignelater luminosus]
KGENIWDRYTHQRSEYILDGSNGDFACDSYNKYKEDIALMKELGIQLYRFSLSWSRILPIGLSYKINPDGIRYYNDVINLLIKNNIVPMVTLFHWDTPQPLEDLGGFANELMAKWFEEYANVVFQHFGDRVKLWLTFNEPTVLCLDGYGGNVHAPGYNLSGIGEYLCIHNMLKAHARAYHLYDKKYKPTQKGKVSITLPSFWFEPASDSKEDADAAQRMRDFAFGWYADPIFHPNGDYPTSMKTRIAKRSKQEGFPYSRLPEFTKGEVQYIKGTYDYLGLNHYTTQMVAQKEEDLISNPSFSKDIGVSAYYEPFWPGSASPWLKVVPWGFRKILNYIKDRYGDMEIYITENGYSDHGELNDLDRIDYYQQYLDCLLDAILEDEINVRGYTSWSLIDNFEWRFGYVYRYGLFHIDFNNTLRPRTRKSSADYYKQVIATRILPRNNSV